jgi:hypothetical membrane protein
MVPERAKMGAYLGLASSIGFLALYLVAIAVNPRYVFGSNYLSDLGDTSGQVSKVVDNPWPFNIACMVGGIFAMPFVLFTLRNVLPRTASVRAGEVVVLIAAFFLILVGVLNESFRGLHGLVTIVFFLGMVVGIGLLTPAMRRTAPFGGPMVLLNLVTLVLCFLFVAFGAAGFAPPFWETIAVIALVLWETAAASNVLLSAAPAASATSGVSAAQG